MLHTGVSQEASRGRGAWAGFGGGCLGSVHLEIERHLLLFTSNEHFLSAYDVSGAM